MSVRVIPDKEQPSVAIEIPITQPLADYDLHQVDQPTPRDIDALLVSQGFRDLVDDSRGVLMEIISNPPHLASNSHLLDLDLTDPGHFEITQLTGAICPADDEVYRPGLWIVLKDTRAPEKRALPEPEIEHVRLVVDEFVKRMGIK